MCSARGRSSLILSRISPRWRDTLRGGVTECSLTQLRERHSARENQRIYAPKGTPEANSPGGPLQAHRGGLRLTRRPLSRGWGTFLGPRGGWTGCRACSEPRSDPLGHVSTAWVGPPSPCVPGGAPL
jgi:hypothetical protein